MRRDQHPEPFWRSARNCWFVQIGKKQHRLSPDRDEAYRLYHELMARPADVPSPSAAPPSHLAIAIIDLFLDWASKNKAKRTYEAYRDHLQTFVDPLPPDIKVMELKPYHVTHIMDDHAGTWSNNTKNDFATDVQRAFNWAVEEGLIDRSPLARVRKPAREARETAVSPTEYRDIMAAVEEPNLRDLLELAWETGARVQELRVIEARHVDLGQGRIVFPPREAKGKRRHRVIYLTAPARALLARLMERRPSGPLLRNSRGEPWVKDSINCAFIRLRITLGLRIMKENGEDVACVPRFRKCEVEPERLTEARRAHRQEWARRRKDIRKRALELSKRYHLGAFRKGYATEGLKNGVDTITLANLMGHVNGAMLSRIYAKVQQDPDFMAESARRAKGLSAGGDA
jgi:integrase